MLSTYQRTSFRTPSVATDDNISASGLLSEWRMDDATGSTVTDYAGGRGATFGTPAPLWYSRGVKFPGDASMTTPFVLDPAAGDFSAFVVFKHDRDHVNQRLVSQQNGTGLGRNWLWLDGNAVSSSLGGTAGSHTETLVPGRWYLAGVTVSGTTLTLYVGDSGESFTRTMEAADGGLVFGASNDGSTLPLLGGIAYAVVFDNALSSADVTQLQSDLTTVLASRSVPLDATIPDLFATPAVSPVVTDGGSGEFDDLGVRSPEIVEYDANTWIMFYSGMDGTGTVSGISYATAPKSDPHNWTKHGTRILTGQYRGVSAVLDGGTWYLYTYSDGTGIELFTGTDLASLSSQGIVLGPGTYAWDEYAVHCYVRKDGSDWVMLYDSRITTFAWGEGAVCLATSSDGITWTRSPANPLLHYITENFWEDMDAAQPVAATLLGHDLILYSGWDGSSSPYRHDIGYAKRTGSDFEDVTRGRLLLSPGNGWDDSSVSCPAVFPDGSAILYYQGGDSGSTQQVGYALVASSMLWSDTFTDTSGTSLDAHDMDDGPGWVEVVSDWDINASNQARVASYSGSAAVAVVRSATPNVVASATMPAGTIATGPVVRTTDFDDGWLARVNGSSELQIVERSGGVTTVRDSTVITLNGTDPYTLEFTANGSSLTLRCIQGGSEVGSVSYASSLHASVPTHGLWSGDGTAPLVNEFELTDA